MNVTIWADHGPNVLGMSDNLHLAKLLTKGVNASASAVIKPRKDEAVTARSSA